MKENAKDKEDNIIIRIQKEKIYFNSSKFIDVAKMKLSILYRLLKSNHFNELNNVCTDVFCKELRKKNNSILNMDEEIDFINVQRGLIKDFRHYKDYDEIDVSFLTMYIDYMCNNDIHFDKSRRRYFNNVYLVTFQVPLVDKYSVDNNICPQCGGHQKKMVSQSIYVCDYCNYQRFINYEDWKISDIKEV